MSLDEMGGGQPWLTAAALGLMVATALGLSPVDLSSLNGVSVP